MADTYGGNTGAASGSGSVDVSAPGLGQYGSSSSGSSSGSSSLRASGGDYSQFLGKEEGYDLEFVPQRSEKYDCPICLLVLREPQQTECGHRFCRSCILKWLRESETRCPVDNQPLEERQLFPDNFAKREILSLSVKCPNHVKGCDQIVVLNYLQAHVNDCPYALTPCPNECANILLRRDLASHLLADCPKRKVTCSMCNADVVAEILQSHLQSCPKLTVKCPSCNVKTTLQDLSTHRSTECQKEVVHCSYQVLGCTHSCERQEMQIHRQSAIEYHMSLMQNAILFLFRMLNVSPTVHQQMESVRGNNPMEISVATDPDTNSSASFPPFLSSTTEDGSIAMIQQMFQRFTINPMVASSMPTIGQASAGASQVSAANPIRTSSLPVTQGQNVVRSGGTEVHTSERASSAQTQVTETSFSSGPTNRVDNDNAQTSLNENQFLSFKCQNDLQDESLARHDQILMELREQNAFQENLIREMKLKVRHQENLISEMEGRCGNGVYIWKIKNYVKLRQEARKGDTPAVHSGPFYSSFYGYKLCIRVNLNGVDGAKGSHLSLFIHFMQGEYDDLLDWPFSGRIILTIVDQNPICELRQHISETLMSKPNLAAFQKPVSARNHKGFGYMEFVPLSTIDDSTFIRNDSLIIKVNVIPTQNL